MATKIFEARIMLADDGTDNMVDRLREVLRNATIVEFGNLETEGVYVQPEEECNG